MALADEVIWRLEQHICRVCFGRILSHKAEAEGARIYRCADCGTQTEGAAARVICCCGAKLNARSAGIRCEPNQSKRPEFPFEIVARQI
jgi:hypothetical protein